MLINKYIMDEVGLQQLKFIMMTEVSIKPFRTKTV